MMGWTGTTRTRPWTGTPRGCGARTSSRASRRPSPSTLHVAGGKSSCQTRGRCMVSTLETSQKNKRRTITWKSVQQWMHESEKAAIPQRFVAWRKQTSPKVFWKEEGEKAFLPHAFVSQLRHRGECFLSTHSSIDKSVPVALWPKGRFFQSHQHSESCLLPSWEHLPLLTLWFTPVSFFTALFFTAYFYAHCFTASSLPHSTFSLCLLSLHVMRLFLHTPVSLGEFCLQVTGWSWFL